MRKLFSRKFTIPAVAVVATVAVSVIVPVAMSGGSSDSTNTGSPAPVTAPTTTNPTTTTSQAPDPTTETATTEVVPPPTTPEVTPPPDSTQPPEVQPTLLDVTLTPGEASSMPMDIEVVNGRPQCRSPYEGVQLHWEQSQDFAGNDVYTHMGEDSTPTVYVEFAGAFNPIVAFIADGTVVFDVVPTKHGTEIAGVMRLQAGYMPHEVVACTDADW